MRVIELVYEENQDTGLQGLVIPKHRDWMDPTNGLGIAHDIFEHSPNDSGTVEEEFMALGAMIFVREGNGYFSQYGNSCGQAIGNEFLEQHHYLSGRGQKRLRWPGISHAIRSDEEAEVLIQEGVQHGRRSLINNLEFLPEWAAANDVVGWLRKGYRNARHRYAKISQWQLHYTFQHVRDELDKVIKGLELGDRIKLHVDARSSHVHIQHVNPEYGW